MKNKILPAIFVLVFALSRIPGLMPQNFSVAYAFMFCAGAFFPRRLVWWLPFSVMLLSDVLINRFSYHSAPVGFYMIPNYLAYGFLLMLGIGLGAKAGFFRLILSGLLGSIIFYLLTNTFAWFADPAYAKSLAGWIQALTVGRPDFHPTTWEMFRNTLLSAGIFTTLFAGTAKLASAESPAEKTAGVNEPSPDAEPEEVAS